MKLYIHWDEIRIGNVDSVPRTLRAYDHSDINKRIFTFESRPRAIAEWYVGDVSVYDLTMDISRESGDYYLGFSQFDVGLFDCNE